MKQRKIEVLFSDAGRIVRVTPGLAILLDPPKRPPVTLTLTETCTACGTVLASWAIPVGKGSTMISCECSTAVVESTTPEEIAKNWKGVVQLRSQCERQLAPRELN